MRLRRENELCVCVRCVRLTASFARTYNDDDDALPHWLAGAVVLIPPPQPSPSTFAAAAAATMSHTATVRAGSGSVRKV